MMDVLLDSVADVAKTLPVLVIVYTFLYWAENRMRAMPALLGKAVRLGPVLGAAAGAVPQCGFSAAASALFLDGCLAPATLVAVFLATSDEAIPVLLGSGCGAAPVVRLLLVKTSLAVAGGYLLGGTVFRCRPAQQQNHRLQAEGCACCTGGAFGAVILRTLKTALLLLVVLALFNAAVYAVGEARISALLLSGSLLQPLLCATLGLIPSCAVSVLLAELYAGGAIGFGSMVAGLSTGAGFGYMILLSDKSQRKNSFQIILFTWLLAAAGGIAVQLLFG